MGLDLAKRLDLCATVKVFSREVGGKAHYYAFTRTYLPEAQISKPEHRHFQKWAHEGWLTSTSGNATDYQTILDDVISDTQSYTVRELAFDPAGATHLTQIIDRDTATVPVEIIQNKANLSPAMLLLEELVTTRRIHHNGDPVLGWCISNVISRRDALEQVFPYSRNDALKLDAHSALLDALCRVEPVLSAAPKQDFIFEVWS